MRASAAALIGILLLASCGEQQTPFERFKLARDCYQPLKGYIATFGDEAPTSQYQTALDQVTRATDAYEADAPTALMVKPGDTYRTPDLLIDAKALLADTPAKRESLKQEYLQGATKCANQFE